MEQHEAWQQIVGQARALGFGDVAVAGVEHPQAEAALQRWLDAGYHGQMDYMARHGTRRSRPAELLPGTLRVLSLRFDYLPASTPPDWRGHELARLDQPGNAVVSVYARGRDYHKVLRQRLAQLVDWLQQQEPLWCAQPWAAAWAPLQARVFTDSAPVLEVSLARSAGLGWAGRHSLLLRRDAGSMFFLGEIFINWPLPLTPAGDSHCGSCRACVDACPTGAILEDGQVDARRCISYLTIEHDGAMPPELRPLIGSRVYGCDDCQLVCPWNKYARRSDAPDWVPRHGLEAATLLGLWAWSPEDFDSRLAGSAIRRIGWARWRRNLVTAMGNALVHPQADAALRVALLQALQRCDDADPAVQEHRRSALAQASSAGLTA
ncbi:tRNA epoxyqueuosine(34) reductase QueG [Amphibiibacter pelophylacis]|uniref:tRNA epoxyqueuosine(34) reductase QueG n=1 Tax=Amphibiibacter pelophylacis TaxID=1799477 RepID=A0ACC6NZS2_9BURK